MRRCHTTHSLLFRFLQGSPGVQQQFATQTLRIHSGKEKAHKHKQISPVTARVGGQGSPDRVARGLPTGGQRSKVYVLCAEPKEHKHFRPGTRPGGSGTRPGGSVTGVTEKLFMCQMFMCLNPPRPFARSRLGHGTSEGGSLFLWKPRPATDPK